MAGNEEPAKQLLPFLQRADELQKHDRLVAYYCRLYAMEKGLKIPAKERTKDTNALLISLMNQLEKDKKVVTLGPDDNLYMEGFAQNVFAKADKIDRAGRADINTAKTFYAASIFFEVLRQFAELQPDLEQKQKYAIWKAADIRKAIAEGRRPTPGPPGGDPQEAVGRPGSNPTDGGMPAGDAGMGLPSVPVGGPPSGGYPPAAGGVSSAPAAPPSQTFSEDIDLPSAPSAPPRLSHTRSFSQPEGPPPDTGTFAPKVAYPPGYGPSQPPPQGGPQGYGHSQSQSYSQSQSHSQPFFPPPGGPHLGPSPSFGSSSAASPNATQGAPSAPFLAGAMAGYPTGASSRAPPPGPSPPRPYLYPSASYGPPPSEQYGGQGGPPLPPPASYSSPSQSFSPSAPPGGSAAGYPSTTSTPPPMPGGYGMGSRGYGNVLGQPSGPTSALGPPSSSAAPVGHTMAPSIPPAPQQTSPGPQGSWPSASAPSAANASKDAGLLSNGANGVGGDYQPPPDKIVDAHKAARFAVSALAFDDVPTALAYLRQSLQLLTSPSPSS